MIVEAIIEPTTPLAPCRDASLKSGIRSLERKQLSSTTMELSTIIPMAITSAPSVIIFREKPATAMTITVTSREIGMELPTIRLAFQSPKNRNRIIMDRITPMSSVLATEPTASRICSDISMEISIIRLLFCSSIRFMTFLTSLTMPMVPAV